MDKEYLIGIDGTVKLLVPMLVGLFYWIGGRRHKWIRRFIAPLPLVAYTYFLGSDALLSAPLYVIAYMIGYGKDSKLLKWLKDGAVVRLICGFLYGAAALGVWLATGNTTLYLLQIIVSMLATVIFSKVLKLHAAQEENLIAYASVFLVPWFGSFL